MSQIDYSSEVKLVGYPLLRYFFLTLSWVFLAVGFIGIFLPVLPTTPFILLAAYLYSKSSVRFYNWVMNHKTFGPGLRKWKETRSISRKAKILAVIMLSLGIGSSILLVASFYLKGMLALIGLLVALFILTRKEA